MFALARNRNRGSHALFTKTAFAVAGYWRARAAPSAPPGLSLSCSGESRNNAGRKRIYARGEQLLDEAVSRASARTLTNCGDQENSTGWYAVELPGVPLATADLPGSSSPDADGAAGGVDHVGLRVEIGFWAKSRSITAGLGGLDQRGQERRLDGSVIVKQEYVLRSTFECVPDAQIGTGSETKISFVFDYIRDIAKLIPERRRLTRRGAVIDYDNASV